MDCVQVFEDREEDFVREIFNRGCGDHWRWRSVREHGCVDINVQLVPIARVCGKSNNVSGKLNEPYTVPFETLKARMLQKPLANVNQVAKRMKTRQNQSNPPLNAEKAGKAGIPRSK